MLNELEKDVLARIMDKLEDTEIDEDSFETAFTLWESENISGSITYNAYEAEQWIGKHFSDLGDVVEEYREETGDFLNPFKNPETFMVIVVIEVTQNILAKVWEEGITKEELIRRLEEL